MGVFVEDLFMFHLVSKQRTTSMMDVSFFIYIKEAKKLLSWLELVGAASVCSFGSHIV